MTSEPDHEFLSRAARELRETGEPGWPETAERLVRAAREATRRSVPLRATFIADPEADGVPGRSDDRLTVSDQVVLPAVRRAADGVSGCRTTGIDLFVEDGRCTGASLRLRATYGTDLLMAGAELRSLVPLVLAELLGPRVPDYRVEVAFIDVGDR